MPGTKVCEKPDAAARSFRHRDERSEDNFYPMKISREVRDFAAKQNQSADPFLAVEVVDKGMAEMSERFRAEGGEIHLPATDQLCKLPRSAASAVT